MEFKLPLILYDAQCPLCLRFKQALEHWDASQSISYVPVDTPEIYEKFPQLDRAACEQRVHLLRADGTLISGGALIAEVVRSIPQISRVAWLLETEAGQKASEFFYQTVDSLRQRLKDADEGCGECPRK